MSSLLPLELLVPIFQLRSHLCYRICRDSCKKKWLKNITAINAEYRYKWVWDGDSLSSNQTGIRRHFKTYNYRRLSSPQFYRFDGFIEKMFIYRGIPATPSRANFLMTQYFYSLRPQFECKDWFLRFLASILIELSERRLN